MDGKTKAVIVLFAVFAVLIITVASISSVTNDTSEEDERNAITTEAWVKIVRAPYTFPSVTCSDNLKHTVSGLECELYRVGPFVIDPSLPFKGRQATVTSKPFTGGISIGYNTEPSGTYWTLTVYYGDGTVLKGHYDITGTVTLDNDITYKIKISLDAIGYTNSWD